MTIERAIRILEMVDSAPGMVSEAKAMAIRSLEAWEKAKAKLGNYSLYPINEWLGLRRAMKIVLETLGEVGETDG